LNAHQELRPQRLKFVLNEGVARWQLASGETLLAGVLTRLARPLRLLFLVYLLPWSRFVGSALISACGVTGAALLPVFVSRERGQLVFGVLHSLLGIAIVRRGGFRLFERAMGAATALLFVTVAATAVLLAPDVSGVARGLFVPSLPEGPESLLWTLALVGGVGGTLTILAYGYWIREEGRTSLADLRLCRIDLACGYAVTAFFGAAMVLIGSTIEVEGSGTGLIVALAERLDERLGPAGRLAFLLGAWAAVFTSLLGVWQAVPLLFADFLGLYKGARDGGGPASLPYRLYLYGLGLGPLLGLGSSFRSVQRAYALVGAGFLPLLALALFLLNGRRELLGAARNSRATSVLLLVILCLFAVVGWFVLPS
jgi:Mn2+/Fe2+ NRAMP family transporter